MTDSAFQGRSFLAEKILYTRAELEYLSIGLSAHGKTFKNATLNTTILLVKHFALCLEKISSYSCRLYNSSYRPWCSPRIPGANDIQLAKKNLQKILAVLDGVWRYWIPVSADVWLKKEFSGVPVWNGLTDEWHPTQMLADHLTVQENFDVEGLILVYCGDDANNVANSLPWK